MSVISHAKKWLVPFIGMKNVTQYVEFHTRAQTYLNKFGCGAKMYIQSKVKSEKKYQFAVSISFSCRIFNKKRFSNSRREN